jgi:PAS domain S-box-containing protein
MTPRKILVTEDDAVMALELKRRLCRLGYDVPAVASSSAEAVAMAAETRPDLVLMDIMLGGEVDGIETAKRIRAQADIPVIYLTATDDNQTLQRVQETEVANYLLKPYRERELQISIEMALKNHELKQQLREANNILETRVRKRTAELESANHSLREQAALLDETQDAIMVLSLEHRVRFWNRAAQTLYGWTAAEAIDMPANELLLQGTQTYIFEAAAATLSDGKWSGETTVFTKSGNAVVVQSRWTLLRGRDAEPNAFLIAHTDLTERKLLEEKFLRAQRLESVGALASGIAHDLNNVFTPILIVSQALQDAPTSPRQASMIKLLNTSAQRGSDMVKQVLGFARGLEGGMAPLLVQHLLGELANMMRETFPRHIKIESDVSPGLWPVLADSTQIYQVFINLCINARDAMPDGGTLIIGAKNLTLDKADGLHPTAQRDGPHICVYVSDNGTGMPPEIQKRIFEPFFTTKGEGKGTGLGLSTVRTIVTSHSGFLELESSAGSGTRFSVFLPSECMADASRDATAQTSPHGNGELLLFVDDESATREVVKTTLEAHGYDILLAGDGAEAVALFATQGEKIALLITDLMMPFLDGTATIRAIRRLNPKVKVLAATGALDSAKLATLENGEAIPVVKKPFSQRALLAAIHDALHSG